MIVQGPVELARYVDDTDFSDLTSCARSGPAELIGSDLHIPFEVEPSAVEQEAIVRRLTTATPADEILEQRAADAIADLQLVVGSSGALTNAQLSNAVRVIARVVLALVRLKLRRLESTD